MGLGGSQEKISSHVDFPVKSLDIRKYCCGPESEQEEPVLYDLYAVTNHFGGLNGGHYTACAFNEFH